MMTGMQTPEHGPALALGAMWRSCKQPNHAKVTPPNNRHQPNVLVHFITPRKQISDAVDDAARRPKAPHAPAVLGPIAAIAQSCAMSEVAAEQGIRATCAATPMLSDT
jgi:hypothetical protein